LDYGVVLVEDAWSDWGFVRFVFSLSLFGREDQRCWLVIWYLRKSNLLPWPNWRLYDVSLGLYCVGCDA
jgi:hypothetical protein